MYRSRGIIAIIISMLVGSQSAHAQMHSVNYDPQTVAAMSSSFATESMTETSYKGLLSTIREHYQNAETAAAGIFASKFLDRRALTDMGLWTSNTENYYYRRIYNMVSAKIMPKIWNVAGMMLKSPQNAFYWGTYLDKVCNDTRNLCYQFESIVTNGCLNFNDIAFLEINQELASLLKLSELGDIDWKTLLGNMGDIRENFSKESLQQDLDNLYSSGYNLVSTSTNSLVSSLMASSNFHGTIMDKTASVIEIADHVNTMYEDFTKHTGENMLNLIGGQEALSNLFSFSNYNATQWLTDYAHEGMGQYYTQRWYIYRTDQGSEILCNYAPHTAAAAISDGGEWIRFYTNDKDHSPTTNELKQILNNSEVYAGWTQQQIQDLNNTQTNDRYEFIPTLLTRYIYKNGNVSETALRDYQGGKTNSLIAKAYSYSIRIIRSWNVKDVKYEEIFDSYNMDYNTFRTGLQARLEEINDNEEGLVYTIGSDTKRYYQTTNAKRIAGCETATISVTCHDGTILGEGTTQYKCQYCGGTVNEHTRQCAMLSTISETDFDTSELDSKISEAENRIAILSSEIEMLESENSELIRKIQTASVEAAALYRQQYNENKARITSLHQELDECEALLSRYNQARAEYLQGESSQTDDHYRIPAIMQDCKTSYNLTWDGSGSWNGNTFVRTASMPNIQSPITFEATISIARKPKSVLGIRVHRAIIQIEWKLSTEFSDNQVVAVIDLEPDKSDQEKAEEINDKVSEIAREYPDCEISVEYAKAPPEQTDDTSDTYHLLWSSDRLEIAREIDSRLTKIYSDLVSLEKMMRYKHSVMDIVKTLIPYINEEEGRRLTLVERCRKRWLRHAANSSHSDNYNGKYEDDEDYEDE